MAVETQRRTQLTAALVEALDPYTLLAYLGKRVIHPGGRRATEQLYNLARLSSGMRVRGVATTSIEIARRFNVRVTAADISPLMLELARANVERAGVQDAVEVGHADMTSVRGR